MGSCSLLVFLLVIVLVTSAWAETSSNLTRRNGIPVIYARGTTYEVGCVCGSTFKSMITEYLDGHDDLNNNLYPKYNTPEGKQIYDDLLALVTKSYPDYIAEIQGIADCSEADIVKILLLHFDSMMSNNVELPSTSERKAVGCSSFLINQPHSVLIGHNEDSFPSVLNRIYILQAVIENVGEDGKRTVDYSFSSVCYAGEIGGYTSGFNNHGLVYSINVVEPKVNPVTMMPRHFVCRDLLRARDLTEVKQILTTAGGPGIGDGISVNAAFYKPRDLGRKILYNIEAGPGSVGKSAVDVLHVNQGTSYIHTNRFRRLNVTDKRADCWESSEHRENRYEALPKAKDEKTMLDVLGDTHDKIHPFFRNNNTEDGIVTAVTGVFNLRDGTWKLFVENPKDNMARPVCVLPLKITT